MEQSSRANVAAQPAASVLPVRDGPNGLEVLMMRRPDTMRFAPGVLVFPGGKVDAEDNNRVFWGRHVNASGLADDGAYRIAALRELYEETGIWNLVGRQPLNNRQPGSFKRIVRRKGWTLDVRGLIPFAHWVTPEPLPMRFDTLFYLCAVKGMQQPFHDGTEAMEVQWHDPRGLLASWEADQIPLMFPTRLTLMKLARARSASEALAMARVSKIVKTTPVLDVVGGRRTVTIPPEAGYGVTHATQKELHAERPASKKG